MIKLQRKAEYDQTAKNILHRYFDESFCKWLFVIWPWTFQPIISFIICYNQGIIFLLCILPEGPWLVNKLNCIKLNVHEPYLYYYICDDSCQHKIFGDEIYDTE